MDPSHQTDNHMSSLQESGSRAIEPVQVQSAPKRLNHAPHDGSDGTNAALLRQSRDPPRAGTAHAVARCFSLRKLDLGRRSFG
jgi:hypothetical protein